VPDETETELEAGALTVGGLRELFIRINRERDLRYEQRFAAQQEALGAALDAAEKAVAAALAAADRAVSKAEVANEKRFDSVNEFRGTLTDQASKFINRSEHDIVTDGLQKAISSVAERLDGKILGLGNRFDSEIKPISEKIENQSKPNWPLMASVGSLFLLMVSGVWLIIGLKIDAVITPVVVQQSGMQSTINTDVTRISQLENVTNGSVAADVQSRSDRGQLNDRVRNLENMFSAGQQARNGQMQTIDSRLAEVETQFCASDIVRNLIHASDMRITSIIWHKTFPDSVMPTDNALYPQICNRPLKSQ